MTISSQADLDGMSRIGQLVGQALQHMSGSVCPGMTTRELDEIGAKFLSSQGARSGPQLAYDFPGFNCISVNEEAVHGVPRGRVLRDGDVLKIDVTAELNGYIADAAVTVVVGKGSVRARRLRDCARSAFCKALEFARAGTAVAELGRAVESEVKQQGFAVLEELTGHGVGRAVHEAPQVPNYYAASTRGTLLDGMVIALEPIISEKPAHIVTEKDGWTLRTHNRALAAHYEHTIVIRDGAPLVLTAI